MTTVKDSIRTLYLHTHECLDIVVRHAETMPPALFAQPIPAFAGGSVQSQLVHLFSVEGVWIARLQGLPLRRLSVSDYPTAASIHGAKRDAMRVTLEYIDRLDDDTFERTLTTLSPEWVGPAQSPAFILQHIVTHAFHHKGQIASMFRILGHPIGDTDLQRL